MTENRIEIGGRTYRTITLNTVIVGTGAAGYNAALRLKGYGQEDIAMVSEGVNMGTSRNTGSDKQTYYKLNLCADFLGESPDAETAARHVEHFLALGGEKAVCLGTDFDGIDASPRDLTGVQDMENLYETLLRRGHSEALVRDIFWGNLLAYFDRVL